ncbi:MAG: hypothetical protein GX344_01735 [Intrasporangiaceae bacterium]|nr:hypothetical protein [Intrasporangiaceae bacterium]
MVRQGNDHRDRQGSALSRASGGRNSPTLRSFGRALLTVGLVGVGVLLALYVVTDNARVDVAIPLLVVFILLGLMLLWQGRRH